jgi:hypothetical protein
LLGDCEEVGLKVKEEEIKYNRMLLYRDQNSEQNHDVKVVNIYFGNMAIFKYLETRSTGQNLIHLEIKSRF